MSSRLSLRLAGALLVLLLGASACGGDDGAEVRTIDDDGSSSGSASGSGSGSASGSASGSTVEEPTELTS